MRVNHSPSPHRRFLKNLRKLRQLALGRAAEEKTVLNLSEMLEATKLLNSTLDLPELLDVILLLSKRLCAADRGTVFFTRSRA